MKFIDLTGRKFGKLLVLEKSEKKGDKICWKCRCDCGKEKVIAGQNLKSGKTVSCNCSSIERISVLNKTHGEAKTRLYNIWAGMKSRCYNENDCSYKNYGSRGIKVCQEWYNSYETFRDWAFNNGYNNKLSIDRINNNGNYSPENCRWTTNKEQSNNTSRTIILKYNGNKYSVKELAELLKLNYKKFLYGIHKTNGDIQKSIDYAKLYKKGEYVKL